MKRLLLLACLATVTGLVDPGPAAAKDPVGVQPPSIQIAILLDTSNSMDGLIQQAKTQLWTVVNQFIKAKRDGKPPRMEVALFEYGNDRLSPNEGFVRLVLPLTDDLDKVSEQLFALTTNGGSEFCGKVIQDAVVELTWSRSRDVYKAIFIAGNEPFTQGPVDFRSACRAAIGRGILVNTIFCGPDEEGQRTSWRDGALLADGRYMSIDHNRRIVHVAAPQDAEIARLNTELNKTYIPYGRMGHEGAMRQAAQDANAVSSSPSVLASRAGSKVSQNYMNSAWDLVDAIKTGQLKLDDLKAEDLPESLRSKSKEDLKSSVSEAARKREEIQRQVLKLNAEREKFLVEHSTNQSKDAQDTLDAAIVKAIRSQASRLNFTFE